MPHADPSAAHAAAHVLTEWLAAIVLIGSGTVILALSARRHRQALPSPVVLGRSDGSGDNRSLRSSLGVAAVALLGAGATVTVATLAGITRGGTLATAGVPSLIVGGALLAAGGAVAAARTSAFGGAQPVTSRVTAIASIAVVPAVGVAFLAVVLTLAIPETSVTH